MNTSFTFFFVYLGTGDEIHKRRLQIAGTYELSICNQSAHASVLDAGPLQTATLCWYRQLAREAV